MLYRDDPRIGAFIFDEPPAEMRRIKLDRLVVPLSKIAHWVIANRAWDKVVTEDSFAYGTQLHFSWLMWTEDKWQSKLESSRRMWVIYLSDDDDLVAHFLLSV